MFCCMFWGMVDGVGGRVFAVDPPSVLWQLEGECGGCLQMVELICLYVFEWRGWCWWSRVFLQLPPERVGAFVLFALMLYALWCGVR